MQDTKVTNVRYVGFAVPDLDAERVFYNDVWGLREVAAESNGVAYFAAHGSDESFVVRLRRSEQRRLDLIGLQLDSRADVERTYNRLTKGEVKLIDAPHELSSPGGGYGFRCFDLDGRTLELSADVSPATTRALARGESIPVQLSHVVLHTPDVAKAAAFYERELGFRISDWIGKFMCFLRCNAAHHRLAFLPGAPALNHVAYDVRNVDEMMRGIARLAKAGLKPDWGPGRHTAGANTFAYFTSPNGLSVEYTAELESVDDATWTPTIYPFTPEVTDQWGTGRLFVAGTPHMSTEADPGLWSAPPV